MVDVKNYIGYYENIIDSAMCKEIIESNWDWRARTDQPPDANASAFVGGNASETRADFDEDWIDESFQHTESMGHIDSVIIGSDVWIGRNVTISSGVVIGDGCVIGQGSLVNKDCKPYGIYAGYPAKLKGYRFSEKHINQLLDIKWWNWPMDLMKKNSVFFNTNLKFFKGDIKKMLLKK